MKKQEAVEYTRGVVTRLAGMNLQYVAGQIVGMLKAFRACGILTMDERDAALDELVNLALKQNEEA